MWSKSFTIPLLNGKEVTILLMDTLGTFDSKHTVIESSSIFALSTMVSSIQGKFEF